MIRRRARGADAAVGPRHWTGSRRTGGLRVRGVARAAGSCLRGPPPAGVRQGRTLGELVGAGRDQRGPRGAGRAGTDLVGGCPGPRRAPLRLVFGPAEPCSGCGERLRDSWPAPFDVRPVQPLLVMDRDPTPACSPAPRVPVHWGSGRSLDGCSPRRPPMFAEEVGYSPLGSGAPRLPGAVQSLRDGRTAVLTDHRGTWCSRPTSAPCRGGVCQIQGVG
ncbi:DUF4081 domain-containing protein [Kocuria rhizophila]|nr:DUF4081 domain-containing protein [Kocuria rhizophila]